MNNLKILSALIVAILLCHISALAAYTADQPISQIQSTVEQALLVITDKSLQGSDKYAARQRQLFELVDKRFDFPLMGKLALGKSWTKTGKDEQNQFIKLFSSMLKNSYIRRVDSYTGSQFFFTKQIVQKNLAMVYSYYEINHEKLSINYKMQKKDGDQWLVFDVELAGVSIVKQYRRQFQEILKNESMQALNKRLADKVESLARASKAAYSKR